jgi:hypothetical protein
MAMSGMVTGRFGGMRGTQGCHLVSLTYSGWVLGHAKVVSGVVVGPVAPDGGVIRTWYGPNWIWWASLTAR